MIEYVNEAGEVTMGTNFGGAYDKEWAIQDQARRDEIEEEMSIKVISNITEFPTL